MLCSAIVTAAVVSCSEPVGPTGDQLTVCHLSGTTGSLLEIYSSELSTHRSHGDYVTRLVVDKQASAIPDSNRFTRIGDAIAAARTIRLARNEGALASCRITIAVGPGVFQGSTKESSDPAFERFPLVFDVPGITLQGSFKMQIDAGGRATGTGEAAEVTTLVASPGLAVERGTTGPQSHLIEPMIIVNAHPDGPKGHGIVIEGFVFQSGNGSADAVPAGKGVIALRAQDLVIQGNRFEGGFSEPIHLQAASGRVDKNYFSGRGGSCGICLDGPGDYQVSGNRLIGPGGIPGIIVLPMGFYRVPAIVEPLVLPATATVTATVINNEVRNHQQKPVGAGLRVGGVGPGAPDVIGSSRVTARDNTFVNNTFGVMVEAAFPVANTALRGDIDVTLQGNTISGSCQNNLLVSFARNSTGLGVASSAGFQSSAYLRNSTYSLKLGGDLDWKDAWFAHPAGNGNTLLVDGQTMPNGSRVAYDAARNCPP
ncbi:MAG: hypothetical protein WKF55_14795 [Gemmatimonadaceae bacterium]